MLRLNHLYIIYDVYTTVGHNVTRQKNSNNQDSLSYFESLSYFKTQFVKSL